MIPTEDRVIFRSEEIDGSPRYNKGDWLSYHDISERGDGVVTDVYFVMAKPGEQYTSDGMRGGWWYELDDGRHVSEPICGYRK